MLSKAKTVDAFLQEVPAERAEALSTLRKFCVDNLVGYEETMKYGMPSYMRNGKVQVAFNSQKNYISLYILKKNLLAKYKPELRGVSLGKGCIRYTSPEKIRFDIIEKLLAETVDSREKVY
mgnify:CR=1 FL=1